MPRALATLATLATLALVACDPTSPSACEAAGEIDGTLAIGIGDERFEPVSDGDTIDLVFGSQGGLMVLGALEVTGIVQGAALFGDKDNPLLDFQLFDVNDYLIGGYTGASRHFVPGADDVLTLVGETVVLDSWDSEAVEGSEVTLSARILDACGRELTAERTVILSFD